MSKDKYLRIVFSMFLVAAFASFYLLMYMSEQAADKAPIEPRPKPCLAACLGQARECKAACSEAIAFSNAIGRNNESLCEGLSKKIMCQSAVRQNAAASSGDIDKCDLIEEEPVRMNCRQMIVQATALFAEDPSVCESSDDSAACKDYVYRSLAQRDRDASACEMLSTVEAAEGCKKSIEQLLNPVAEELPQEVIHGFLETCDVQCENSMGSCEQSCDDLDKYKSVIESRNTSLCSGISGQALRDQCSLQTFI